MISQRRSRLQPSADTSPSNSRLPTQGPWGSHYYEKADSTRVPPSAGSTDAVCLKNGTSFRLLRGILYLRYRNIVIPDLNIDSGLTDSALYVVAGFFATAFLFVVLLKKVESYHAIIAISRAGDELLNKKISGKLGCRLVVVTSSNNGFRTILLHYRCGPVREINDDQILQPFAGSSFDLKFRTQKYQISSMRKNILPFVS